MTGTDMLAKAMSEVQHQSGATPEELMAALGLFPLKTLLQHQRAHDDLIELEYQFRQIAQHHNVYVGVGSEWSGPAGSLVNWAAIEAGIDDRRQTLARWIERVDHGD